MRHSIALFAAFIAGCAPTTSRMGMTTSCITTGPVMESALTESYALIADTSGAAKELRDRLGLGGLHPAPKVVYEPELCRRAVAAMSEIDSSDRTLGVVLIQVGPVYAATSGGARFPRYYFGQRRPFGPKFEVIEVVTAPD